VKVNYYVFKDYQLGVDVGSDEEALELALDNRKARRNRYSFVSMRPYPQKNRLFLGTTHGLGDLLVEFNLKTKKFRSCGYARSGIWGEHEHKIHKGIWLDEVDNALYFGTSTLSPISKTVDCDGGKLVRYDIATREFKLIAAPTPGDFYQATGYDRGRQKMYMYTMPGACFAAYDLKKKKLVRKDPMESIPHIGTIDDDGGVWGTWGIGRQAFYRYLPDTNTYEFPPGCAFPEAHKAANIMYLGAGPIDSMITADDGYIYTGSALGEMIRIDPRTKEITYLGKPFAGVRLPGMYLADDGYIYVCGGTDGVPLVARYDRDAEKFEYLGRVVADDGTTCQRCHELCVIDGVVYIGETDNQRRSGYLWTCEI
jgi:hypothetical protein